MEGWLWGVIWGSASAAVGILVFIWVTTKEAKK